MYSLKETDTFIASYPPASKASREVANLTERKNPHTPVYGVKEFTLATTLHWALGLQTHKKTIFL